MAQNSKQKKPPLMRVAVLVVVALMALGTVILPFLS